MGRGFQGQLALRLSSADGVQQQLRYSSLGNTARLQLDAVEPTRGRALPEPLDLLIWGDNLSLMDHEQRTMRTIPLRQIRPSEEPEPEIETQRSGNRRSTQGVFCEDYSIQEGSVHVDACVGALPGEVDVDKFEGATGIDVPAWAEQLLKEDLLPLQAVARDDQRRVLYRLELAEYSAGPVNRELLSVPADYRQIAAEQTGGTTLPRPAAAPGSSGGEVTGGRAAGGPP